MTPHRLLVRETWGLDTPDFRLFARKSCFQVNNRVFRSRMLTWRKGFSAFTSNLNRTHDDAFGAPTIIVHSNTTPNDA